MALVGGKIQIRTIYHLPKYNQYSGAILEGIIVDRAMIMYVD